MYDLIIRNGRIADGSGLPAFTADLAIQDGRVARIGRIAGDAAETIDAAGKVVAPGFIDPHTHFDAQLLWDGYAKPALSHGVTTIVPGNCSLSLAPLKAEHRMKLVGMFNQIEEMPLKAFEEGVEWNWETFDEFVTRIKKDLTINVAPLVGHSVLRLWVMGDESMHRTADEAELSAMQDLLRQSFKLSPQPARHIPTSRELVWQSLRITCQVPSTHWKHAVCSRLANLQCSPQVHCCSVQCVCV